MIIAEHSCKFLNLLCLYFDSLVHLLSIIEGCNVYLFLHEGIEPIIELWVALGNLVLICLRLIRRTFVMGACFWWFWDIC